MNGIKIPLFMQGEELPKGYYDDPNPYAPIQEEKYRMRAMVNYALEHGKSVPDLTKEEANMFLIKHT